MDGEIIGDLGSWQGAISGRIPPFLPPVDRFHNFLGQISLKRYILRNSRKHFVRGNAL
jgi:hypothetical protein